MARAVYRRQNRGGTVELTSSAPNKPASARAGAAPVCILQTIEPRVRLRRGPDCSLRAIEPRVRSSAAKRAAAFQGAAGRSRAVLVHPLDDLIASKVLQGSARRGQGLVGRKHGRRRIAAGKEASAAQADCGAVLLASQRIEYRKRDCRRRCGAVEQRTPARKTAGRATPAGTHAAGERGGAVAGARVAGRQRSPL